ncbi:TolC family protein [Alkalispirochaeta americana]|uniref:TolC family protein n=1 Tax=Alkalispirochaeta americana TaxID=159291 RepID=UPI0013564BF5|nr:TolC family protein [Alkalispirochaeta americana]
METAVDLALAAHLGLRSRRIDTLMAARDYQYRHSLFIPEIALQGSLARPNESPEAFLPGQDDPARWRLDTALSATLTLSPQMIHSIRAVTQSYRDSRVELEDATREIDLEVRKAFYQLLMQEEQLLLGERRLEAALERVEEVRNQYEAGLVDELTLRQVQVSAENQRPALVQQRRSLQTARYRLGTTLGIRTMEGVHLTGKVEPEELLQLDQEELLGLASRNDQVRAAQRAIESARIQKDLARSALMPSLSLGVSLAPSLTGDPWSDDLWQGRNWDDGGSFSVTLRQPLDGFLPGSSTRQKIENQEDRIIQARIGVAEVLESVEVRVVDLLGSLESSAEAMQSIRSNIALAERTYELAREAYAGGLRDYSVVRDAEIDLADARLQLLQEQHTYRDLLLDLSHLLQTPLPGETRDTSEQTSSEKSTSER